ncbi:hypothetical protein Tco_0859807 [Tanacetum coccineum]|uniref:Uncharacterized protein n=1 Tax=Tanacetum coccineum TaxID=301880 RepID=A0ABQ5BD39_9ASTR
MPTEMELTLEQTQQGVSYEVSSLDPVTLCTPPPSYSKSERLCFKTHGDTLISSDFSHSELVVIGKDTCQLSAKSHNVNYKIYIKESSQYPCDSAEHQSDFIHNEDGNPGLSQNSNKLLFNTSAGNPVKKILLKLNLSDHRLCKMVVEVPDSSWLTRSITTCSYPTDKHKVIMKAQNFKKDATLKLFKNGMSMSSEVAVHKVAKLQDGVEIVLG